MRQAFLKEIAMKTRHTLIALSSLALALVAGAAFAYPPGTPGPAQGQQTAQWRGQQGAPGARMGRSGMMQTRAAGVTPGAGLKRADLNGDGSISKEESQSRGPMFQQRFAAGDSNKDGVLDATEIKTLTADCPLAR